MDEEGIGAGGTSACSGVAPKERARVGGSAIDENTFSRWFWSRDITWRVCVAEALPRRCEHPSVQISERSPSCLGATKPRKEFWFPHHCRTSLRHFKSLPTLFTLRPMISRWPKYSVCLGALVGERRRQPLLSLGHRHAFAARVRLDLVARQLAHLRAGKEAGAGGRME